MCTLSIKGVDVRLPSPLRPQQKELMEAFMDCLLEGKIGMLESADCIGRSVALLCSSLGWLLHNYEEENPRRVLYLCGTDQNLRKIICQFTETSYVGMRIDVLNKLQPDKNVPSAQVIFSTHDMFFQELISISDTSCLNIDFPNTLIVVDDSHLVEDAIRNAASATLSLCDVDHIIQEFSKEGNQDSKMQQVVSQMESLKIISKLEGLKKKFRCILPYNGNNQDPYYGGKEIKSFLHNTLDESDMEILQEHSSARRVVQFISNINRFCCSGELVKSIEDSQIQNRDDIESFAMYLTKNCSEEKHSQMSQAVECKTFNLLCLDPSVVIKRLIKLKPHSIVFSSATISPFDHLKAELGILETKELVSKSFIEDHQIFARIVTCGAGGYFLNSSYSHRFDKDYLTSVGRSILEIAKVTPQGQGMNVYFSSYEFLNTCKAHWEICTVKGQTLWKKISEYKDMFSCSGSDFHEKLLHDKKGSCVLAVMRGEMSKDTSIKIEQKRVIVIVGVPFPPEKEPAIKLKCEYIKKNWTPGQNKQTGAGFLEREAYKAVNLITNHQINSNDEYGVILLLDLQFKTHKLSPWLRDKVQTEKRFPEMMQELNDFFSNIGKRTDWIMATSQNPTQSSTQFGSVHSWEMEKLRLDYLKLKKKNALDENYLQRLKENISSIDSEMHNLQKELYELTRKEMTMKISQSCDNEIKASDVPCKTQNESPAPKVHVSPIKSPRKRGLSE